MREATFPIGASVTLEALASDPYPIYRAMQESEPIFWVPALGMYYVVRYDLVDRILKEPEAFTVDTERSTLFDPFGVHMLTAENPLHARYKSAYSPFFLPAALRDGIEAQVRAHAASLIAEFSTFAEIELRAAFAGVKRLSALIGERIAHFRVRPRSSALLSALVHAPVERQLDDEEIIRNSRSSCFSVAFLPLRR